MATPPKRKAVKTTPTIDLLAQESRGHSRISPSGLGSLAVCPHFTQDNDRPEHPLTKEGTMLHSSLEHRRLDALPAELRPIAQVGIDFWDALRKKNPDWQEEIEPCIQITEEMKGHLDLIRVGPEEASQVDWKGGLALQATAATNIQQAAYAIGLFKRNPEIKKITVYLVYLRLQEVDFEEYEREQLPDLELKVLAILRRAQAAQRGVIDERTPDPKTCTYCSQAGSCPALHKLAIPTAQAYAQARPDSLKVPEAYDPALISDPAVMAKALTVAGIMETWVSSVKKHALQLRMDLGLDIPGTTLAHRVGTKTIVDPNSAFALAEKHGVTQGEFMTAVKVSAPELIDIVSSKAAHGKKKFTAQVFEDELRDSGALSVGPETFFLRKSK